MRPHHVTLRDPELPHQVVFLTPGGSHYPAVSCNCMRAWHGPGRTVTHDPMGPGPDLAAARALYNNPANHRKPFDPAIDGAKW